MGFEFLVSVLAVWRASHLLALEDGPFDVFSRLRRAAGTGFWGTLVGCLYCVSLWLAAPVALFLVEEWRLRGLTWLALSGGAILLERATSRVTWHEEPN